jgi:hypothetical protein
VEFKLKKPLYEWRTLGFHSNGISMGNDLFLSNKVKSWLDSRNIVWTCERKVEKGTTAGDPVVRRYLHFYINIENRSDAMLFKLTWM